VSYFEHTMNDMQLNISDKNSFKSGIELNLLHARKTD